MLTGLKDFGGAIGLWYLTVPSLSPGNMISKANELLEAYKKYNM